ncbi:MAG: excinuclease ABC subunit UvrC [Actinomycetota bacterium]
MITKPASIPDSPGSYLFKDAQGRVIYVGKASSLRQRLANYFQDPAQLHPRTAQMVATATSVEWVTVRNEVEALILEYNLIKEHRPRFNIRLRDDKSYPLLAVTVDEQWPRAVVMRGQKRKGTRYFGPYPHSHAIRETLDLLLRTFPIRTCSQGKFNQHQRLGRPCLLFHIEKCSGPCVGEVTADDYSQMVSEFCRFLEGETDDVVDRLRSDMEEASRALEFERAARLRDRLQSVGRAMEKQQIVGEKDEDIDVIGVCDDELEAAIQVFYVRNGRVVGRKGFIFDKVDDLPAERLADQILELLYGEEPVQGIPKVVLMPSSPLNVATYEEWLSTLRTTRVEVRIPQRGTKKELLELATRNATEEFHRHKMRRSSDHNSRSRALTELQEILRLPEAPLRIECYDMAHLQGTDYVGSMVVLEDGIPAKREYRRFKVKNVAGNDDYAAMEEVLTRRLQAYLEDQDRALDSALVTSESEDAAAPVEKKPGKFSYPPQLLLVDGGKGQLAVAERVVRSLGLADEIPIAALAKRFEEVYVPGRSEPVDVPRGSEALFMLQRIRDEAHRFANAYHRELRNKRMVASSLEGIDGLGEARRKRLVQTMGGVKVIKAATLEELLAVSWLPDDVARAVYARFHPDGGDSTDSSSP